MGVAHRNCPDPDAALDMGYQGSLAGGSSHAHHLFCACVCHRKCSDPDAALEMASDAWERFAAVPAVQQLLARAQPATRAGHAAFVKAHDAVVAHPLYARAVEGASQVKMHSNPGQHICSRTAYTRTQAVCACSGEGITCDNVLP